MKLEEVTISAAGIARKAWYLAAPVKTQRLGVLMDGEIYIHRMDAPKLLWEMQKNGQIPAMDFLWVSHVDAAARHDDFTCNETYAEFLTHGALPWMRERNRAAAESGHLLAGTSLSGLQAAFTALEHPGIFTGVLCHSGSFWWNKEWLTQRVRTAAFNEARFWLSVGSKEHGAGACHSPTGLRQEIDQIDGVVRFAEALKARGTEVHFHQYPGGHDCAPWRAELPDALRWLAGSDDRQSDIFGG